MELELRGKRALVTGSTAGIGHAIATRLATEGASVVITGRSEARVAAAVEAIRQKIPGAELRGVTANLDGEAGAARLIQLVQDVDVLVNNVGIYGSKPFEALTSEDWRRIFEVNVLSGARLSQHHLPRMLGRGHGRIIFISSESAVQIPAEMIHYGVSKTAQSALARGLAGLTRGSGVTVNSVLAGPTRSEGVVQFVEGVSKERGVTPAQVEKEFFSTMRPTSLLQRFETPEEIANVVAFIASPLAIAINGAAVRAEGGLVLGVF